uniref:RING-type domain-containing protein n=1 Tax=Meloidogyne incognita TaxID=6306 RepID=A0A914NX60_MELIC
MKEIIYNEAVEKEKTECPICLKEFKQQDDIQITNCGHFFHFECISEWFYSSSEANHKKCPLTCHQKLQIYILPKVAQLNEKLKRSGLVKVGIEEMYKLVHPDDN